MSLSEFLEIGSVKGCIRSRWFATVMDEQDSLDVPQSFIENPKKSVSYETQNNGISFESSSTV